VEGAEVVPLIQSVDKSTRIENAPTVPLAIPESEKPVGPIAVATLELDQSTKVENQPTLPFVVPDSLEPMSPLRLAALPDETTKVENQPTIPLSISKPGSQGKAIASKNEEQGKNEMASLDKRARQ